MKLKIGLLVSVLLIVGLFAGCTGAKNNAKSATISHEKAKTVAFSHAGVDEKDIYDFELDFDRESKTNHYDIEFKVSGVEYEYEIDAVSGEILKAQKEGGNILSNPAVKKTADEAKLIAFAHAEISEQDALNVRTKLDFDDGVEYYEVEFIANGVRYEYDIHAVTGEILKFEKE